MPVLEATIIKTMGVRSAEEIAIHDERGAELWRATIGKPFTVRIAANNESGIVIQMQRTGSWIDYLLGRNRYIFKQGDREITALRKRTQAVTTLEMDGRKHALRWNAKEAGRACEVEGTHLFLSDGSALIGRISTSSMEMTIPLLTVLIFEHWWRLTTA